MIAKTDQIKNSYVFSWVIIMFFWLDAKFHVEQILEATPHETGGVLVV